MSGLFWHAALVVVVGALLATHVVARNDLAGFDKGLFRPHAILSVQVGSILN